ncbi:MAG: Rrf2 family transcriptional regulator [Pseudomonadota bacterium]
MRRLGDGVEASLHCAAILAELPKGKVLSGKDLAELHGISESYLLKHLRSLTAAAVTEALPGPRGGYRLARAPSDVSLLDIVEAIDGKGPAFICREIRQGGKVSTDNPCAYKKDCFIKRRMLASEKLWRDSLKAQTLEDLLADGEKEIDKGKKAELESFIAEKLR